MRSIHGSALSHPFRPDNRGTLAAVADPAALVAEQVYCLVMTRQGERGMLPDYGLPDVVFAVKGANFVRVLRYFIREQITKYVPGVETVDVREEAADAHASSVVVEWTLRGSNVPHNLVFPTRQLRGE